MGEPLEFGHSVPLQRQQSLQVSIAFIQQQHAETLKSLHEEIQKLQKRCSDLTFQLAMETTSSPQEDFYREKSEAIQTELDEKTGKLKEANKLIEKKDRRINALELQLKAQEKKYSDALKEREQQIRQMKGELTERASMNAELMLKRLSTSQENAAMFRVTAPAADPDLSSSASDLKTAHCPVPPKKPLAPHPPREGSGQRLRRRTSPRAPVMDKEPKLSSNLKSRGPSGRAIRRSNSPEVTPDPTPFLQRREETYTDIELSQSNKPLPPISRKSQELRERYDDPMMSLQQTDSYTFVSKPKSLHQTTKITDHSSGSSSPEVEVLDTVVKRNQKIRHTQEYNADCK